MMKYSVNHYWKFSNYNTAFLAGLLQVLAMLLITVINYAVITIEKSVIDVAKDFTALYVVAEFDNYFSFSSGSELPKDICTSSDYEQIFLIETTTSLDADHERSDKLEDDKVFKRM